LTNIFGATKINPTLKGDYQLKYTLTKPCDQCPFLIGSGFTARSLDAHSSGEFACHKTCTLDEDGDGTYQPRKKSPHCAGALIYLEKREKPHQMMRICARLGMYDPNKLDMLAPVR